MSFSRRLMAAGLGSGLAYAGLVEPWRVVVRRFEVELPHLPPEADGLRIAQMSDLHLSAIVSRRVLRRAVDLCNAEQPDLVVVTGDFVSRRGSYARFMGLRTHAKPIHYYAAHACAELSRLEAREGVLGVLGNHDHAGEGQSYHYGQRMRNSGAWLDTMLQAAGVQVLINRSVRIRGLAVVGIDDWRSGDPNFYAALQDVAADEPILLLSHNPRVLWLARERSALVLAGHTHGGQVRLPGVPPVALPGDASAQSWTRGWYTFGRAKLYVTAGVGCVGVPFRFACPPEIAVFTLRAA